VKREREREREFPETPLSFFSGFFPASIRGRS
jgi:hypothetical protein